MCSWRPWGNEVVPRAGEWGGGFQPLIYPCPGACYPSCHPALAARAPPSGRQAVGAKCPCVLLGFLIYWTCLSGSYSGFISLFITLGSLCSLCISLCLLKILVALCFMPPYNWWNFWTYVCFVIVSWVLALGHQLDCTCPQCSFWRLTYSPYLTVGFED